MMQPIVSAHPTMGVSVIICGKNEAHHLTATLSQICDQAYPNFEVIFIDDNSTDTTATVVAKLQNVYKHLYYYKNEHTQQWLGKKGALDYGIQKATHQVLLLTDADCQPSNENWLSGMMQHYEDNIVIGYAPYYYNAPGVLQKWIQWETLHTFLQYSSYAYFHTAYMGVGRNMLYSKKCYYKALANKDFLQVYNKLPSGDDDLLLQEMAAHTQVAVCIRPDCFPYSPSPPTWKQYWHQKARHISTGKYYHVKPKLFLGLYGLSHGCLYASFFFLTILCLFYTDNISKASVSYVSFFTLSAILLKILLNHLLFNQYLKHLHLQSRQPKFLVLGDLFWAFYNLILSPYILIKNKQKWKY